MTHVTSSGKLLRALVQSYPHLEVTADPYFGGYIIHCKICKIGFGITTTAIGLAFSTIGLIDEIVGEHFHITGPYDEAAAERYIQLAER